MIREPCRERRKLLQSDRHLGIPVQYDERILHGRIDIHNVLGGLDRGYDAFFEILQSYNERFADGNARTADFIAVAEEISGQELSAFFDDWLYSNDLAPIPEMGLEAR